MKNKGFTLVELILVVVILGIVSAVTVPALMKSLNESKQDSGKAIEKVLKENLELYNIDHKEDIWCISSDASYTTNCASANKDTKIVYIKDLYNMNPDIDMGECLLQDAGSLKVTKEANDSFSYEVKIICGKDLQDNNGDKIIDYVYTTTNVYYKTK